MSRVLYKDSKARKEYLVAYRKKNTKRRRKYGKLYRIKNADRIREYRKKRIRRVKERIIEAYGGECACCGEKELNFLSIDHINDDGRTEKTGGVNFYCKIIKAGFPKRFRILCLNCNMGRYFNGGTCPHGNGI